MSCSNSDNNISTRRRTHVIASHLTPSVSPSSARMAELTSNWADVPEAPRDSILGLSIAFKEDPNPNKVDLGIGAYRTDEGKPLVLRVVNTIEKDLLQMGFTKEYLPQDGLAEFKQEAVKLVLGADSPAIKENRVAVTQAISGTGALRVGFEFIKAFMPGVTVYLPSPTWNNHNQILNHLGINLKEYRYYHSKTRALDFDGMIQDLRAAPDHSVVLLHLCAHNPTGVDPEPEQWHAIADVVIAKKHIPFFDSAYQGFASGDLVRDSYAARHFVSRGIEIIVAQSFSKNFGLYGERVGSLLFVCKDTQCANNVLSQLKKFVRVLYSNPPIHGARIVQLALSRPDYFRLWEEDLKLMSNRIISMRQKLYDALIRRATPGDWTHITKQIGMFSYTGLTPKQVEIMVKEYHIYMLGNGRISMAGLNSKNVEYVADAMHAAVTRA